MATFETVCEAFARQAHYCDEHGSPLTARVLRGVGHAMREVEPALHSVASWQGDPVADALPLRVAGALHALVLNGAAPELARYYPGGDGEHSDDALRQAAVAALRAYPRTLADYLASPPQTNEVGRSAVLCGGFTSIAAHTGLSLRLFELGASAGLNAHWDRYRYRLGGQWLGDAASPLELAPVWHGATPPLATVEVVERMACDQAPVDLADPDQRQRLRAYVWADQVARLRQLELAMEVAARDPLQVEQADAVAWLERMLATPLPVGAATVIYHTIFWTYLAPAAQRRVESLLQAAGETATAAAPLAWLRLEIDDFQRHPRLLLSLWPGPQNLNLADAQAHGSEIFWHASAQEMLSLTAPRHGRLPTSLTINRFGEPR
ncbi:DUF2332 domain-containing protein [Dyella flagellata]|uniref:DUF2332 domain-containing protein n=1 Tax=Dyella flagellata TaxID=1867833 RepID=A0ABQ5X7Q8_9GAMM|nr:DUF2332 family protein [Dyella flagellata]GLQ87620.1 hypothetical protein GCM10007898_11860 [Dyella flagellata]